MRTVVPSHWSAQLGKICIFYFFQEYTLVDFKILKKNQINSVTKLIYALVVTSPLVQSTRNDKRSTLQNQQPSVLSSPTVNRGNIQAIPISFGKGGRFQIQQQEMTLEKISHSSSVSMRFQMWHNIVIL